jgi:UDP-glucuronate decarboxylase
MRILVTGGAGFIGSHLCERLLRKGHDVICLDNFFTGSKQNIIQLIDSRRFELIRHDIIEPVLLEVDQIYNLACPASPVHYQYNPVKTVKTSVMGTINMLGLAKRVRARILQASTSEVYGDPTVHPQNEGYWGNVNPVGVRSCYDEGKRVAETLMMDYHRQNAVDIRIVRIFNTFGPRMSENDGRVVSNFIVQALRGEDITVYGDGSQTRSFCYVDDLVEGLIRMMGSEGFIGRSTWATRWRPPSSSSPSGSSPSPARGRRSSTGPCPRTIPSSGARTSRWPPRSWDGNRRSISRPASGARRRTLPSASASTERMRLRPALQVVPEVPQPRVASGSLHLQQAATLQVVARNLLQGASIHPIPRFRHAAVGTPTALWKGRSIPQPKGEVQCLKERDRNFPWSALPWAQSSPGTCFGSCWRLVSQRSIFPVRARRSPRRPSSPGRRRRNPLPEVHDVLPSKEMNNASIPVVNGGRFPRERVQPSGRGEPGRFG